MSVIRDLCDRVVVLESGRVVEEGAVIDVFVRPRSPVTRSLLQEVLPQLPDDLAARLSPVPDRKSTRLNSKSLMRISYAVFCLKKNKLHLVDTLRACFIY